MANFGSKRVRGLIFTVYVLSSTDGDRCITF